MRPAKSRAMAFITIAALSLSISLAYGQGKLTTEQKAGFNNGNAVLLSNYDVVEDRTSTLSMQRVEKDAIIAASFSYPSTVKIFPSSVIVSVAAVHQEFRWEEVEKVLLRYGGKLHTFPLAQMVDGKSGYKVETNQIGAGWLEKVSFEIPTADFISMSHAELIYMRIGDNANDTFSIEGKTSQVFKNIDQEISSIKPDAIADVPSPILKPSNGDGRDTSYSEEPLNLNLTQLPPNYRGQNPADVYNSLVKKFREQQEFETKEDYKKRLVQSSLTPVIGNISMDGYFVATVGLSVDAMKYDADRRSLKLSVPSKASLYSNSFNPPISLQIGEEFGVIDTYIGQNGYGVEKQVDKTQTNYFELIFRNPKDFKYKDSGFTTIAGDLNFLIPMLPSVAMSAKPDLRMLIVYQLQEPYIEYYKSHVTAKVTDPEEKYLYWHYINANARQIWFYNATTGEVYQKISAQKKR